MTLPEEVAFFIAQRIRSNVRELEGALKRVIANARLTGREITVEFANEALKDLLGLQSRLVTIENIQKTVAEYFKLRVADLLSQRRSRSIARPRQVAMMLAKELTQHSLPEIGDAFGGRDHTTVLHACKRVKELQDSEPRMREDYSESSAHFDGLSSAVALPVHEVVENRYSVAECGWIHAQVTHSSVQRSGTFCSAQAIGAQVHDAERLRDLAPALHQPNSSHNSLKEILLHDSRVEQQTASEKASVMKFTATREQILSPLQGVIGVVEREQTMPILANVLLAVKGNDCRSRERIWKSSSLLAVRSTVQQPGEITLPGRKLLEIARALPDNTTVTLTLDGDKVKVSAGRSRFVLSSLAASGFPGGRDVSAQQTAGSPPGGTCTAHREDAFFDGAAGCPVLPERHFARNGRKLLRTVATDGHRLAIAEADASAGSEGAAGAASHCSA